MKKTRSIFAILILMIGGMSVFGQAGSGARKIIDEKIVENNKAKRFDIDATYPQMVERSAQAGVFNKAVKDHVKALVDEFKGYADEMTDEDRQNLPEDVNYTFDMGYDVEYSGSDIVSVSFGHSTYTGGAHPNHFSSSITVDMKGGKVLSLSDLFKPGSSYLKVISDFCIADITEQQEGDADEEWIGRGAGPDAENFKSWAVTKEGLKFYFDPYAVGPYAAGPFEVVVPFEKFPTAMRAAAFWPLSALSYIDGNPPNWCRGGLFTQADVEFSVMKVNGSKTSRAYFYSDDDDCPEGAKCQRKAYVVGGDEVIASRTYGNYVCAWYQPAKGLETVGWLRSDQLRPGYTAEGPGSFTGEWVSGENNLSIRNIGAGALSVKGNAFWKGLGDNIHIGEVDDQGSPHDKLLLIEGSDEYECSLKIRSVGNFLVVSDNKHCGGVNVSFDGVYRKSK